MVDAPWSVVLLPAVTTHQLGRRAFHSWKSIACGRAVYSTESILISPGLDPSSPVQLPEILDDGVGNLPEIPPDLASPIVSSASRVILS